MLHRWLLLVLRSRASPDDSLHWSSAVGVELALLPRACCMNSARPLLNLGGIRKGDDTQNADGRPRGPAPGAIEAIKHNHKIDNIHSFVVTCDQRMSRNKTSFMT